MQGSYANRKWSREGEDRTDDKEEDGATSRRAEEKAVISEVAHRAVAMRLGQLDRDKLRTVQNGGGKSRRGIVLRGCILHERVSNGRADERTEGRMISSL